jgi:hypothetical protein
MAYKCQISVLKSVFKMDIWMSLVIAKVQTDP